VSQKEAEPSGCKNLSKILHGFEKLSYGLKTSLFRGVCAPPDESKRMKKKYFDNKILEFKYFGLPLF